MSSMFDRPSCVRWRVGVVLGVWLLFACSASAQELFLGKGWMQAPSLKETSWEFPYGYKQYFTPHWAASMIWLNEGHVTGHHRDGSAWQGWCQLPFDQDAWQFSVGAGLYYFFDTVPAPGGSRDAHGTAFIGSAALTYYPWPNHRYFARLSLDYVDPHRDIKVQTIDLSAGLWLGRGSGPKAENLVHDGEMETTENELSIYPIGTSVENAFRVGEHRFAWAVEYRKGICPYLDGTISYVDETNLKVTRRRGFGLQAWAVNAFGPEHKFGVGTGAGIYTAVGHRNTFAPGQYLTPIVAPYFSVEMSYRLGEHAFVRVTWNRVTGYDSPDADVLLVGVGLRWK